MLFENVVFFYSNVMYSTVYLKIVKVIEVYLTCTCAVLAKKDKSGVLFNYFIAVFSNCEPTGVMLLCAWCVVMVVIVAGCDSPCFLSSVA